jgi:hypothetical protein
MVMDAANVLSEEEDAQLRRDLMHSYTSYLHTLLTDAGLNPELCSFQFELPYIYYLKDGDVVNQEEGAKPMAFDIPTFTITEFKFVMKNYGNTVNESTYFHKNFRTQTKDDLLTLPLFLEMCSSRYFLVSARLDEIGSQIGHQTILLFDKEKKECIVIEPQLHMPHVIDLYQKLFKRLDIVGYTIVEPPDLCVQAVAKDRNCMFWSLLLVTRYLQGKFTSIKDVHKTILSEHPTTEDLKKHVDTFKYDLHKKGKDLELPKGGKRWGISMANRNRRRTHQRRPRKTNSRNLKSARRTRRRV